MRRNKKRPIYKFIGCSVIIFEGGMMAISVRGEVATAIKSPLKGQQVASLSPQGKLLGAILSPDRSSTLTDG
jgi:hypothetical protein